MSRKYSEEDLDAWIDDDEEDTWFDKYSGSVSKLNRTKADDRYQSKAPKKKVKREDWDG